MTRNKFYILYLFGYYLFQLLDASETMLKNSRGLLTRRILALDFDGVICASSKESSESAVLGVKRFWCNIINDSFDTAQLNVEIMSLRPIIETGYENMLVCRLLMENYQKFGAFATESVSKSWGSDLRDNLLIEYQTSKANRNILVY